MRLVVFMRVLQDLCRSEEGSPQSLRLPTQAREEGIRGETWS